MRLPEDVAAYLVCGVEANAMPQAIRNSILAGCFAMATVAREALIYGPWNAFQPCWQREPEILRASYWLDESSQRNPLVGRDVSARNASAVSE